MSADDLNEEQVIERFRNITDRIPAYLDKRDRYKNEILEEEEADGAIRKRIKTGIKRDKKHDTLLKQTISAFLPGGPIESETGWRFLGAEPLSELNISNADALFGNPDRDFALIVECKTSDGRPTRSLEQVYQAAEEVRENKDLVEDATGITIDELECAICVPSIADRRIASEIERHEQDDIASEQVYLWRIHYYEGETLDLYDDINTRSDGENTHNSSLAPLLSRGVDLTHGQQVTPAFFPSSHPEVIMEEVFGILLEQRLLDDKPFRHFTGSEIEAILKSQRNLPHYDAETIGERIYGDLIDRCLRHELIEEVSPSETELDGEETEAFFKFRVRGKSVDTVLTNLRRRYIEMSVDHEADIEAMRIVIDEFDEDQSSLTDF
ncbi:hypothetical protein ACFQJC_17455 [Haloferax namakaokahaiae]|uniref:Restriction endonuclease n=1 Tax=Haloferax namakaokahaiae TaxID=1748331 RepID=A0ABD5ZJY7_9EURY